MEQEFVEARGGVRAHAQQDIGQATGSSRWMRWRRPSTCARSARRGLVHHSDGGSPYASDDYRRALETNVMVASMSRTGDCWANAVAESFFATLKAEVEGLEQYRTHLEATSSIADYIDGFYNPTRRLSSIGLVVTARPSTHRAPLS